ncbi:Diapolycopene oxygenase [Rosistilla carotiformis]|uniref:Diapolycopene oxygenase n=1 Tax=Rosistilla carotiformis TaxID=2528017 RepID=A0A518JWE6_9BACT|nr:phytoene desaturase family protein [Rosistilla carotiformis]QDV69854.1 Diapolycopene oxygenase [Rosistilla carotiformis]
MAKGTEVSQRVVVVGGGLAGLTAACTAAARGHRVILLDKNEWVGGKAALLESGGYRFDMGPTILTLPSVLKRVFDEAGRDLCDYMELVPLDPQWRCFFDGGSVLDLVSDVQQMKRRLDEFTGSPDSGRGYDRFLQLSKQMHEVSERFFFWRSVGSIRDTMDASGAFSPAVLRDVMSLRMGKSVSKVVRQHIPDDRAAQMIDHFTQYVGSSPKASPAVLCGIAHMQTSEGIWYPMGGTRAVVEGLSRLAIELGVEIRVGVDVARILVESRRATGVLTTTGEILPADAVISNCDSVRTYRELLKDCPAARWKLHNPEPACSGVVLYLGLNRRYEQLLHHNFVFSRDPEEEFDYIYRRGELAPEPTCYVCAPAVTEPQVAPEGGEALYVLVHTPYLRPGHDWTAMLPDYRRRIIEKLQETAELDDLESHIQVEHVLTPQDIHNRYRVLNGAIYGLASHGKFTGAFKPANRRKDIRGLYLAGGAAHPGPGMPMVMMSGWIAADSLDQDVQRG